MSGFVLVFLHPVRLLPGVTAGDELVLQNSYDPLYEPAFNARTATDVTWQHCEEVFDAVVEPYDATTPAHQRLERIDEVCIGNEKLNDISSRSLKLPNFNYSDLNRLVSPAMSVVTTSLRFSGQLNSDLQKLVIDIMPFPRLNFCILGLATIPTVIRNFTKFSKF
ncbi:hypothetical protein Aperf_G00000092389 [Anoplocephala perfoliata]